MRRSVLMPDQLPLWGPMPVVTVPPKSKPEIDYHLLRPRRCAWCNSWFREVGVLIPQHWSQTTGGPCLGSNKPESPPLHVPLNSYWREEAACLDKNQNSIFWTTKDSFAMFEALSYCQGCPVLENCYQHAEEDKHFTGVAGGTVWTPRERRRRREARRTLPAEDSDASAVPDATAREEHRPGPTDEERRVASQRRRLRALREES